MTRLPDPRVRPDGPHPLADGFGRVARDLRVSLTDRCNLRCTYCMPVQGLPWLPHRDILSDEEMLRVVGVFVQMGVREVRLTGGEPLLRRGLVDLVGGFAALDPRPKIAMTTNGVGLDRLAQALAEAGLDRVNVSLDTVDAETFTVMTRRPRFADVDRGLQAAQSVGLSPIKVNAIAMRGINDDQLPDLLAWCLARDYALRFIEHMPLDAQHAWDRGQMITGEEIHARLSTRFTLTPVAAPRGSDPAEVFLVDGGPGTVGIIPSVTAPFCSACDRVRLTADGQVRNCLFARSEIDLRTPLRDGATDEDLARLISAEIWRKQAAHGIGSPGFAQPDRPMSAIGG
ncbi:MAG: GTP 3',8-cyclase MoaA [Dermatophilaceae bacterium]